MTDYDFNTLNDKEFESLCADLIGVAKGVHVERFKAGRDGGVDGRFFEVGGDEVILQCKHWANTPLTTLINTLKKKEKPKVDKLKPKKYLLAISNKLSLANKRAILKDMDPHIKNESDILGNEDLNDLLQKNPDVERRHYKLWLCSAGVLTHLLNKPIFDRSIFTIKEAADAVQKYVVTSSHSLAEAKLEKLGVVIISGEPGVGKTTLAEHICLQYVSEGYEFIKIEDEITEAEAVLEKGKKQIFYFDDFLGRNYFEAMQGRAGSRVVGFIRRIVADKGSKRFILTSRSTVLNQGKALMDCFKNQNLDQNEFLLSVSTLSEMDKARILYNHIWFTNLPPEYVDELYIGKRYRKVITHQNFNPRLINFITDYARHETIASENYWANTIDSLNNPADIWDNAFVAQQDDYGRALVLLVTLNRASILEAALATAFNNYIGFPQNAGLHGRRDFQINLRYLSGSLLNRYLNDNEVSFNLYNPSLGDYVLKRYSQDIPALTTAILSLRSISSLKTVQDLYGNSLINVDAYRNIITTIFREAYGIEFLGYDPRYLTRAILVYIKIVKKAHEQDLVVHTINFVMSERLTNIDEDVINLVTYSVAKKLTNIDVNKFFAAACDDVDGEDYLSTLAELLPYVDESDSEWEELYETYYEVVSDWISNNLSEEIEYTDLFSDVGYACNEEAINKVEDLIESLFDRFGLTCTQLDVNQVLNYYDVEEMLMDFHHSGISHVEGPMHAPADVADNIDDLFDRE